MKYLIKVGGNPFVDKGIIISLVSLLNPESAAMPPPPPFPPAPPAVPELDKWLPLPLLELEFSGDFLITTGGLLPPGRRGRVPVLLLPMTTGPCPVGGTWTRPLVL